MTGCHEGDRLELGRHNLSQMAIALALGSEIHLAPANEIQLSCDSHIHLTLGHKIQLSCDRHIHLILGRKIQLSSDSHIHLTLGRKIQLSCDSESQLTHATEAHWTLQDSHRALVSTQGAVCTVACVVETLSLTVG